MENTRFKLLAITTLFYISSFGMANAVDLKFNWQLPAHAKVVSTKIENGNKIVGTYELSAKAINETEVLVESFNFNLVEVNEQKATEIELPATTKALMSSIPSYVVNKTSAQVVRMLGFEEMVEKALSLISDETERNSVTALFKSPQVADLLYAKSADTWNSMVGAWAGQALTKGEPQSYSYKTPMGNLEIPTVTTYLLEDYAGIDGAVKLTLSSEQQIPAEVLFSMVSSMIAKLPNGASEIEKMRVAVDAGKVSGSKVIRIMSAQLQNSLMPMQVLKEEQTKINVEGEEPKVQTSIDHLTFEWSH